MSRRIEIVEVGPRDGLQNEKTLIEVDQKLELINRLWAAGAPRMEVVSFVNAKRVPQMAGAEEIMAALPKTPGRSRIGLVLNQRGWDRCLEAACDEANVVVCATDGFGIRNQGATADQTPSVFGAELAPLVSPRSARAIEPSVEWRSVPADGETWVGSTG